MPHLAGDPAQGAAAGPRPFFTPSALLVVPDPGFAAELDSLAREAALAPQRASTLAAARAALRRETWDVMLVDTALPDGSGLSLLREVRALALPTLVMLVTQKARTEELLQALNAGAGAILPREASPRQLGIAIQRAASLVRVEAFRRQIEARYRQIFDRALDAAYLVDPESAVVEANLAASRLPGVKAPGTGDDFVALWPEAVRGAVGGWLERLAPGVDDAAPQVLELTLAAAPSESSSGAADGYEAVLELRGSGVPGTVPPLRHVMVRDITERVRLGRRALHAERLAGVGRLAADLAHELRNALAGIDGVLQVLQHDAALPVSRQEILGEARHRIDRTREVVFDLLAFVRPLRLARLSWPTGVVLDALVEAVAGHPEVAEVAIVRADRCPAGLSVEVDASHLRLAARNLVLNAAQAMGGRGRLEIGAERRGAEVWYAFQDEGPGVAPELAERVFEPFFTTRHEGTGLGLAIASSIVESHGGRLFLEPSRHGARFVMALPLAGTAAVRRRDVV
jgi:signal transduction histidine kinase